MYHITRAIQHRIRAGIADNARHHASLAHNSCYSSFTGRCLTTRYSPDLAPSDYHLSQQLINFLCGQHFSSVDTPVYGDGFLRHRLQKLVSRY
ncbi:hypothetical protein AVEN_184654-1 [Araneus ventricosus]|uniref:Uncharacterized protein n=1 Tax=Araneus ventricosus TaxID=182803 RepID=A0A4Y2G2W9_ARAVE|nr:hypothetical protein AVEN_184654-1 [Araneus ventricosus]